MIIAMINGAHGREGDLRMPEGIPNVMNVGNYRKFVVLELKEAIELRKMLAFMSKMIPVPMSSNILEG